MRLPDLPRPEQLLAFCELGISLICPGDPGPQLGTPKARRVLPPVLGKGRDRSVLADGDDRALREFAVGQRAVTALAMRDAAVLELLYASGIRVSEQWAASCASVSAASATSP